MFSDQRSHNRVSFFLTGDIYREPTGERSGRVVIRDISFSGLRIETLEAFDSGDKAYMDFDIAGRFEFRRIPVVVARSERQAGGYVTGLHFHRGEDRRRVRHALAFTIESSN